MESVKTRSPWWWVPSLYFAEGIPYFIVNNISVMLFTKMGVPNGQMAFFTTLLYFPWFLKGLWSPLVDVVRTKRWWIVATQLLMTAMLLLLTFSLPRPPAVLVEAGQTPVSLFRLTLVLFIITAFASATHDIAADGFYMLAHDPGSQAAFIGLRSTFYRISSVFGQGILVFIAGWVERRSGDIPLSWRVTLGVSAAVFAIVTLYHSFFLPKSANDRPRAAADGKKHTWRDLGRSFATFFTKPGAWAALVFMLLYRLPEGFLVKMCQPFLVAATEKGGLGLGTDVVGIVYGTIGVIALLSGGIVGGILSSRKGLRRSLWWMVAGISLPSFVFVYLAAAQPANLLLISAALAFEQFGYGFGFTAYMLYMMHFSEGEFKTSHYAICTAFMALSMMLPGFVAGYLQEALGYLDFFWVVMACYGLTVAVTALVRRRIPPEYGKKNA